jgi:hypothetical protein
VRITINAIMNAPKSDTDALPENRDFVHVSA